MFADRFDRGEDLPAAGPQEGAEQLRGGQGGGRAATLQSGGVAPSVPPQRTHRQRHARQVRSCSTYLLI